MNDSKHKYLGLVHFSSQENCSKSDSSFPGFISSEKLRTESTLRDPTINDGQQHKFFLGSAMLFTFSSSLNTAAYVCFQFWLFQLSFWVTLSPQGKRNLGLNSLHVLPVSVKVSRWVLAWFYPRVKKTCMIWPVQRSHDTDGHYKL